MRPACEDRHAMTLRTLTRRRLAAAFAALAASGILPRRASAQATAPAGGGYPLFAKTVGANAVNVRTCPKPTCDVSYSIPLGERLRVTGPSEGGYLPVSRDGAPGYAFGLYVQVDGAPPPELKTGVPGCSRVAFVFNLGVGYETRVELLDWMKANGVPATMFPMGWWAEEQPEALKRMVELGFPIGSHGDQRTELTKLGDDAVRAEIANAAAAIAEVAGQPPLPYYTPYAAATDDRVRQIVADAGYLPVYWDVASDDWDFGTTADHVFMRVMPNVKDGSIVEFHLDAPASKESTVVAVPWIVEKLRGRGFEIVPLADIALPCPAGLPAAQARAAGTAVAQAVAPATPAS